MKYKITYQEIDGNRLKKIRIDTDYADYRKQYIKITDILDEAEKPYVITVKEPYFIDTHKQIFLENSNFSQMSPTMLQRFLCEMPVCIFILFENEIDFEKHLEYLLLNKLSEDNNDKMG